jgi:hypothetical protein
LWLHLARGSESTWFTLLVVVGKIPTGWVKNPDATGQSTSPFSSQKNAAFCHLSLVLCPLSFLQGTRDEGPVEDETFEFYVPLKKMDNKP